MQKDISSMSRGELLAHREYLVGRLEYNKDTLDKCIGLSLTPADKASLFDPVNSQTRDDIFTSFRDRIRRYEKDISEVDRILSNL